MSHSLQFEIMVQRNIARNKSVHTNTPTTKLANTINVKGNRKVVVVKYTLEEVYKIPDGLDLEDKTVVENWSAKYGRLWIDFVDGHKENYPPDLKISDDDKYPDSEMIEEDDENRYFEE